MKKLSKLSLKKAKVMTTPEMKHVTGGYGDGYGIECFEEGKLIARRYFCYYLPFNGGGIKSEYFCDYDMNGIIDDVLAQNPGATQISCATLIG